jgi:UDP-glucose 4-epimerase
VTGAAGFIGVPLVRELLRRGIEVIALDNFSVGSRNRLEALGQTGSLSIAEVDLRDRNATRSAVIRADPWGVVHLAALHFIPYCESHPAEALGVNVVGDATPARCPHVRPGGAACVRLDGRRLSTLLGANMQRMRPWRRPTSTEPQS